MDGTTLLGIITDGDVRRMLENFTDWSNLRVQDMMNTNPKTIDADAFAPIPFPPEIITLGISR